MIFRTIGGSKLTFDSDKVNLFQCELTSEEFGTGIAQGMAGHIHLDNGMIQSNLRNIVTFPALGSQ